MRRHGRDPAAIAAEIDRIRSLRLDALRRQWRLVFGRVPCVYRKLDSAISVVKPAQDGP
jgi:hypothetical protein